MTAHHARNVAKAVSSALLALTLAGASGAFAADEDGRFSIRGIGTTTCSEYSALLVQPDDGRLARYAGWAGGYLSARSREAEATFDVAPIQDVGSIMRLVGGVCAGNPQVSFEAAIDGLIETLRPISVTGESELLRLERQGSVVAVRESVLRQVQQALQERGLYQFAIDGAYGPGTAGALQSFQQQNNLDVNGLPDARTVVALLLGEGSRQPENEQRGSQQ